MLSPRNARVKDNGQCIYGKNPMNFTPEYNFGFPLLAKQSTADFSSPVLNPNLRGELSRVKVLLLQEFLHNHTCLLVQLRQEQHF
jgi:hypothetical protein